MLLYQVFTAAAIKIGCGCPARNVCNEVKTLHISGEAEILHAAKAVLHFAASRQYFINKLPAELLGSAGFFIHMFFYSVQLFAAAGAEARAGHQLKTAVRAFVA